MTEEVIKPPQKKSGLHDIAVSCLGPEQAAVFEDWFSHVRRPVGRRPSSQREMPGEKNSEEKA